jgi:uncharacterized protein (DUF488 family)
MTIADFTEMLRRHGIEQVADVRSIPQSRYNPQFNRDTLDVSLRESGISYIHMPGLGGFRKSRASASEKGSSVKRVKRPSFQGYIEYMETDAFKSHLQHLYALGEEKRTAFMCAEADPKKCHRSMIADALTVRGCEVIHILGIDGTETHRLPHGAVADGTEIRYPVIIVRGSSGGAEQLFLF